MPPVREQTFLATPLPVGAGRLIVAPFQFYTDGAESLRFEAWNSLTGVVVAVQGRWLAADGTLQTFARTLALTADRARNRLDMPLERGYLVTLTAFAASGAPLFGQTYVKASLIRGLTGATMLVGQLLGGHVTAEQGLGWPGSPIVSSLEGPGALRVIIGTDPAAGVEVLETVPTGARWELETFRLLLSTNATAGDRHVRLLVNDDVGNAIISLHPSVQSRASSTIALNYVKGDTTGLTLGADADTFLPTALPLRAGWRVITTTTNFQAGDNFFAIIYIAREWLEVG